MGSWVTVRFIVHSMTVGPWVTEVYSSLQDCGPLSDSEVYISLQDCGPLGDSEVYSTLQDCGPLGSKLQHLVLVHRIYIWLLYVRNICGTFALQYV